MANRAPLAIDGGEPAVTAALPDWPPNDIAIEQALSEVYRDGDWGRYHGARCEQLVGRLQEMHKVAHAHLCSSGTIAVELALRALGILAGDKVLLAGYDFAGNFRAVEAIGATPVLADIDPTNWSLDPHALRTNLGDSNLEGVRAVVVSHLHGGLADIAAFRELAAERDWRIVEDACQVIGASIAGKTAGSWGDVGTLSFGGSKLVTAGRGGALLTNDPMIQQRIKVLTGRGNDATPMSELQAAVLLPQLGQLSSAHVKREQAADRLRELLADTDQLLSPVKKRADASHAYYKIAWLLNSELLAARNFTSEQVIKTLQAEGVPVNGGFRGFASRSKRRCHKVDDLGSSHAASQQTVTLHHPVLKGDDVLLQQIADAIQKVKHALLSAS